MPAEKPVTPERSEEEFDPPMLHSRHRQAGTKALFYNAVLSGTAIVSQQISSSQEAQLISLHKTFNDHFEARKKAFLRRGEPSFFSKIWSALWNKLASFFSCSRAKSSSGSPQANNLVVTASASGTTTADVIVALGGTRSTYPVRLNNPVAAVTSTLDRAPSTRNRNSRIPNAMSTPPLKVRRA